MNDEKAQLEGKLNDINQKLANLRKESENNKSTIENMDELIDKVFKVYDEALSGPFFTVRKIISAQLEKS